MTNRQLRERLPKKTLKEITAKQYPKKTFVFEAGRQPGGGSILAMATKIGTSEPNIVLHIKQCYTDCGYGYKYKDDWYEITV